MWLLDLKTNFFKQEMRMKKETQNVRVAKRLVECGFITTSEAMSQMYITRLAARINDLVNRCDIDIESELIPWGDAKQAKYTIDALDRWYLRDCIANDLV